jgi:hypothetical protein
VPSRFGDGVVTGLPNEESRQRESYGDEAYPQVERLRPQAKMGRNEASGKRRECHGEVPGELV